MDYFRPGNVTVRDAEFKFDNFFSFTKVNSKNLKN